MGRDGGARRPKAGRCRARSGFLASAACTEGGWVLRASNGQFRFTRAEEAAGIDYPRDLRGFAADTPDDLAAAWGRKAPDLRGERL